MRWPIAVLLVLTLSACGTAGSSGPGGTTPGGTGSSASASATAGETGTAGPTASTTSGHQQSPGTGVSALQDAVQSALQAQARAQVEGADVSWPQCPPGTGIPQKQGKGAPMPLPSARFVVLGLTNGPGFYPNPCLADQAAWARSHHLQVGVYSVVSTPQPGDPGQSPFDSGYQQALFNLRTMRSAGIESPGVWVDVENVPGFDWPALPAANADVVKGAVQAYQDHGMKVGVYSTRSLWQHVVGDLRLGLPEWRAAGQTSLEEAVRRCGAATSFQGGSAVLTQWVDGERDRDVTCPGSAGALSLWFHQY